MSGNKVGVEVTSTITVSASGTELCYPIESNSAILNPCIQVHPEENNTPYTVNLFIGGRLSETHTYTAAQDAICDMTYPDSIFPANVGTETIPKFFQDSDKDYPGFTFVLQITNNSNTTRTFKVYGMFEEYDPMRSIPK